jgi:hypothetical protein
MRSPLDERLETSTGTPSQGCEGISGHGGFLVTLPVLVTERCRLVPLAWADLGESPANALALSGL